MKTIKVTYMHIIRGQKRNSSLCPIALAIKGISKHALLGVGFDCIFRRKDKMFIADLPKTAQYFINRFDNNKSVKPFSFKLDI